MSFSPLLLQAAAGGGMTQLVFFGVMMLVFWFFMIRPQAKRQREQGNFMKDLKAGQQVVTSSGVVGRINKLDDKTVTLEVGKVQIPFLRNSISKELTDGYFASEDKA